MRTVKHLLIGAAALLLLGGCAYRYYLGMHGPSIRRFPDVHAGVTEDAQCLACHDPDGDPVGPPTSHPRFVGCLKCHDDVVSARQGVMVSRADDLFFPEGIDLRLVQVE